MNKYEKLWDFKDFTVLFWITINRDDLFLIPTIRIAIDDGEKDEVIGINFLFLQASIMLCFEIHKNII